LARPDRLSRSDLVRRLRAAGCVAAEEEADELLGAALGPENLSSMLARRVAGEPLAWIVGSVLFCDVRVLVHPGVYVPRWQSEPLVRRGAALLQHGGRVVDLCTGSGALALALKSLAPLAHVVGTEIDEVACACARSNGVEVYEGEFDSALPAEFEGSIDLVIGVVPYVPSGELEFLPRDVTQYEPRGALDGGLDGTEFLRRALLCASGLLRDGGVLLLELGGQEDAVIRPALADSGFAAIESIMDEDGDLRGIEAVRVRSRDQRRRV
jgi:release factor glutamine methyltransferase